MIKQGIKAFRNKRVLLLQGPVGPFFRRLAADLKQAGAQVFKVNFNGGDCLFYPNGAINFRGDIAQWPDFFKALLVELDIEVVLLFGDCRPLHRSAQQIAHKRDLEVGVFEEGYLRPDYITFAQYGVNGHSLLPNSPIFYLNSEIPEASPTEAVGTTFWLMALWAALYYFSAGLTKMFFHRYQHHRPLTWFEVIPVLRSCWRKIKYRYKERGLEDRLTTILAGQFFLVPLQVFNDSQVTVHSEFSSVEDFIEQVMTSFADQAPLDKKLVFKHHPLDRGHSNYGKLISSLAAQLNIKGRCIYIHDLHLPTLLTYTCGVVIINSTVGMSALFHGAPLKVCGKACFDMKGLSFQGSLANFWQQAKKHKLDKRLYHQFINYLVHNQQLNGSFYRRLSHRKISCAGLKWSNSQAVQQEMGDHNSEQSVKTFLQNT